jgi:hypothetical protein
MKYHLEGRLGSSLERFLSADGTVVPAAQAEVTICDECPRESSGPIALASMTIPSVLIEAMGIKHSTSHETRVWLSRWYNGSLGSQTLMGFEAKGHMNENLGSSVSVAWASRFVQTLPEAGLLDNPSLLLTAQSLHYIGWLSLGLGTDGLVTEVRFGLPGVGVWATFEMLKSPFSAHLTGEAQTFFESWSVVVLLSVAPWPFARKPLTPSAILTVDPEALDHCYFWGARELRPGVFSVRSADIGVVTAWSPLLSEAVRRVLRTLRGVELLEKQYRTDLTTELSAQWRWASDRFVEHRSAF